MAERAGTRGDLRETAGVDDARHRVSREIEELAPSGREQLEAWRASRLPSVESLGHGLWSIPVPIPSTGLNYVLVYVLETTRGAALVDAGWNTEEAWRTLVEGLGTAGFGVSDVEVVLVTHIHPDHYGLAGRVREASGARIALHPADAELLADRYERAPGLVQEVAGSLRDAGVPDDLVTDLSAASLPARRHVTYAAPDVLLEDGDRAGIDGWDLTALWTPGHSPGHLCFYDSERKLLFSGDHVLPRITPNVTVHPQQRPNPLADFVEALARVGTLDVDEVLPAHEFRFSRLAKRIEQLLAHHDQRFDEIERAVTGAPGSSAWEIAASLSWRDRWDELSSFMRRVANGETLAHLVALRARGRVRSEGREPVRWYAAETA